MKAAEKMDKHFQKPKTGTPGKLTRAQAAREPFHQALLENISDAVILTDDKRKIVYAGGNVTEIFGRTREEVKAIGTIDKLFGHSFFFLQHLEANRRLSNIEHEIVDGQGRYRILLTDMKRVRFGRDGVLYTCRDYSQQKKRERSLAAALSDLSATAFTELSAINAHAPMAMMLVDGEHRVCKANGFAARFAGRTIHETIGCYSCEALRCLHHFDHPKGCGFAPACTDCRVQGVLFDTFTDRGNREAVEVWLPVQQGKTIETRCFSLSTAHVEFDNSNRVLLCVQDDTERKRAEEELKKRLDYEHLLSTILTSAITVEDLNTFQYECLAIMGKALDVSRIYIFEHHHEVDTMDNTVEWTVPGILAQKEDLQGIPASEIPWWMEMMKNNQVINYSDIEEIPGEKEKELLRPQKIMSLLVVPLFVTGKYYGFIGFDECRMHREWPEEDVELLLSASRIITGVIERKRAEGEREKLQAQLMQAQKMESVGRLAGGVAHDYNNMLGVILGHTEMMLDKLKPGDRFYDDLEEIQKAAERSAALTRQLLAFARKQTIVPRVLNLNSAVEHMLKMISRLIGEDIDLLWKPGPELWSVRMDPAQVDQLLANLCVNARDAVSGPGKVVLETKNVTLDRFFRTDDAEYEPGQYVMLAISDNGCGMDAETLDCLFEPFFTTKTADKGTGLGLATVYGIVKQNRGFINVYSEPDQGSTFRIYIPRDKGSEGKETLETPGQIPRGQGETVLLVEDDPGMLSIGKMMLQLLGYVVIASSNPDEAMEWVQRHPSPIHLLVTDVVMPQMSGKDLAQRIQHLKPRMKTLFMSGYTVDVIAHHGVLEEGVQFIQKPFSLKTLAIKVREACDRG